MVKRWCAACIHLFLYLDDGLGARASHEEAELGSRMVRNDLERSGVSAQVSKCKWDPVQLLKWLGFLIDLIRRKLRVPPEKVAKIVQLLYQCVSMRSCSSHQGPVYPSREVISHFVLIFP